MLRWCDLLVPFGLVAKCHHSGNGLQVGRVRVHDLVDFLYLEGGGGGGGENEKV